MRRPLLYSAAALFALFEQVSLVRWFQANPSVGEGLAHAWQALSSDAALFMAWTDMAVFTAVVLAWLWQDLKRSQLTRLYWVATLLMGCPPLLVYLARRQRLGPSSG
jgi:hypothetical protein